MAKHWIWLVLLLTFWLGARGLNQDAIWHDEQRSLYYAGAQHYGPITPTETTTRMIENGSGQSPLFYVLLSGWGRLVGWEPFATRALSLLIGIIGVALIYRIGADTHSRAAGLGAAAAMGASAYFVLYLHELRPYTLLLTLTCLSLWLYWHKSRWLWLCLVALLYTQPFAIPVFGALGVYHLLQFQNRRNWWGTLGGMFIAGLLYLPWALPTTNVVDDFTDAHTRLQITNNLELVRNVTYGLSNGTFLLALGLLPSLWLWRVSRGVRMAWLLIGVMLAGFVGLNFVIPILKTRYTLAMWPLLFLILGYSLSVIANRRRVYAGFIGLWVVLGIYHSVTPAFNQRINGADVVDAFRLDTPIHELSAVLRDKAVNGDAIAIHTPAQTWAVAGVFDFYMRQTPARYTLIDSLDSEQIAAASDQFVSDAGRVWLVVEGDTTTEALDIFEAEIAHYEHCGQIAEFPDLTLDLYARTTSFCNLEQEIQLARFGDVAELGTLETRLGDTVITVFSTWEVQTSLPVYSVGHYLLNADGNVSSQVDVPLPGAPHAHDTAYLPMETLAPGSYRLQTAVYNWQTGERIGTADIQSITIP